MFLFEVNFNSLIKILSWISSLKLHALLARMEKSAGQATVLQKIKCPGSTEVLELLLANFPVSGETPICSEVFVL